MMDDFIKVYRIGEDPIEVPRSEIIWTDRSRLDSMVCPRKKYLEYEQGGTGYVPTARNEDLLIGASVHEGIDLLLQGGSLDKALTVAEECYSEGTPWGDWLLPEQKEVLTQDGLHLVKALVYAFHHCYLTQYREQYQTVEVEEEINWEVCKTGGKRLVCMSRPDAVLKDKATGRFWHVSHKTTKRFDDISLQRLDVDVQRFAEGMAIWAKYGETPEGTLYNFLIKGDKRRDDQTGLDRYTTGLIRPYLLMQGPGGEIIPEMIQFGYEWNHLDSTTGHVTKKRVGKGWEKTEIYKVMDYPTYLDWLREMWVKNEGTDYLLDAVAGMVPVYFSQDHAKRWLRGATKMGVDWYDTTRVMEGLPLDGMATDMYVPLAPQQCFSYNHRCAYYDVCWRGKTPETLLEEGALQRREPNHLIEFYQIV